MLTKNYLKKSITLIKNNKIHFIINLIYFIFCNISYLLFIRTLFCLLLHHIYEKSNKIMNQLNIGKITYYKTYYKKAVFLFHFYFLIEGE